MFNSTEYNKLHEFAPEIVGGLGRSAGQQAAYQVTGLVMSLGFAVIGGLITG